MMKKWISVLLMIALISCLLPVSAESKLKEKTLPMYLIDINRKEELHAVFPDGNEEIPYVSAEEMCRLMNLFWHDFGEEKDFSVTLKTMETDALLTRENGATAYIDFENGTLDFNQYDMFFMLGSAANLLDIASMGGTKNADDPDKEISLILHNTAFVCDGNYTSLSLKDYRIDTPVIGGVGYLPLQTFSDLFISALGAALCYNGEIVVLGASGSLDDGMFNLTELGELYYSVPEKQRSEALAEFTLNELCLALDFHYGLKEEHDIENFRDYFIRSGLYSELLDMDTQSAVSALSRLCMSHFADGHSGLLNASPFMPYGEATMGFDGLSVGYIQKLANMTLFYGARAKRYPEGMPGYEEVGNTAYVTFDHFIFDTEKDYYTAQIAEDFLSETADTVELLIYATRQINRDNSPIENVVIDLSCNGGGMFDAAVCVCSWVLGMGTAYVQDMTTGAKASSVYSFDANLDHNFGDGDSVNTKNLFCLISPMSFSCGNLVPAALRASGRVTVLGKPSTGGACAVQILSAADGSLFAVSGRKRINIVNNGIFYSIDAGVEPHYYLPKESMFYDRQQLTDYINGLMW